MGDILSGGLQAILALLPDSPFRWLYSLDVPGEIGEILGMVNWFIPIYSFLAIFEGWLACIAIYYVYQIVLRWLKAIE